MHRRAARTPQTPQCLAGWACDAAGVHQSMHGLREWLGWVRWLLPRRETQALPRHKAASPSGTRRATWRHPRRPLHITHACTRRSCPGTCTEGSALAAQEVPPGAPRVCTPFPPCPWSAAETVVRWRALWPPSLGLAGCNSPRGSAQADMPLRRGSGDSVKARLWHPRPFCPRSRKSPTEGFPGAVAVARRNGLTYAAAIHPSHRSTPSVQGGVRPPGGRNGLMRNKPTKPTKATFAWQAEKEVPAAGFHGGCAGDGYGREAIIWPRPSSLRAWPPPV
jgi:hypothetical protein